MRLRCAKKDERIEVLFEVWTPEELIKHCVRLDPPQAKLFFFAENIKSH